MAMNLGKQLQGAGYEIKFLDVYEAEDGLLVSWGRVLYKLIYEYAPWLWRFFYINENFIKFSLKFRLKVAAKKHHATKKAVDDFEPDMIIATQTSASAIVAYLKRTGVYKGLFGIAFSDFHLHKFWLYDESDFYLANILEQKKEMIVLGVSEEKIFVVGMSLPKHNILETKVLKNRLGILEDEKILLFAGGSLGYGIDLKLIYKFLELPKTQVIVVCGKNTEALKKLGDALKGTRAKVFGFYEPMSELYAVADVFVSKPGGLSISEALLYKLPVVVSAALPGQEEINLTYLNNRGLVLNPESDIYSSIVNELKSGKFKQSLEKNLNIKMLLEGDLRAVEAVNTCFTRGRGAGV